MRQKHKIVYFSCLFLLFNLFGIKNGFSAENTVPVKQPKPAAQVKPAAQKPSDTTKYDLTYHFKPGSTIRWEVVHQMKVKTSMQQKTEIIDSVSKSTKSWTVLEVDEEGNATVEHKVEDVDMHRKQSDRPDSSYNSKTDKEVTPGYEQVANNLNIPLSKLTVSKKGEIKKKIPLVPYIDGALDSKILIPLPKEPVAVGDTWKIQDEISVSLPNGTVKKIKIQQKFKLERVRNGLALIKYTTERLTPIDDAKMEVQIMDKLASGEVEIDLDTGDIVLQQTEAKGHVLGFGGDTSVIDYVGRFAEGLKKEKKD
ncbi:MAG: hypothetical protein ACRC2T_14725 [Thermoguttaceae bacterium]